MYKKGDKVKVVKIIPTSDVETKKLKKFLGKIGVITYIGEEEDYSIEVRFYRGKRDYTWDEKELELLGVNPNSKIIIRR